MENRPPASRKFDSLLALGRCSIVPPSDVISLPLDQLNNQPETPGPMSVLEWRRAVWFQVQSIHHAPNHQTCCDNSESGDELLDEPGLSRPSPRKPRRPVAGKPTTVPLIDLSQPADADGRPIQVDDGRAKLAARPNNSSKPGMAAPSNIEQRHREAIRRLQAEATEQIIYAEWEASHQRGTSHLDTPKLQRLSSKRATLQKLSDFARRSVSNFSGRTTAVESPSRTVASGTRFNVTSRANNSKFFSPEANNKTGTRLSRMIKKIGSVKRRPSKNKKMFSLLDSEASMSQKSLLSSFQFTPSNPALQ